MGRRRRTNARPSRNELRRIRQMEEEMAYGRRFDADDPFGDADLGDESELSAEEAAQAEIAAYLASREAS